MNGRSFSSSNLTGTANSITLSANETAAAFLPASLFDLITDRDAVGIFFAVYDSGVLFPITNDTQRNQETNHSIIFFSNTILRLLQTHPVNALPSSTHCRPDPQHLIARVTMDIYLHISRYSAWGILCEYVFLVVVVCFMPAVSDTLH